ncbi:MAG: biotin carboxylase N-terminal domain-containing protein, partial [Pseudomonadota bacterium]|nr:biotin carboxylase N-terminal domain-containing protein [Pseudomonadota bacterium]
MSDAAVPPRRSSPRRLLIANRGEIALRIARTALDLGLTPIAIGPEDDADSLHLRRTAERVVLPGRGARAYLD